MPQPRQKKFIRMNHQEMDRILVDAGFKTSLEWDGAESSGYLFARREWT